MALTLTEAAKLSTDQLRRGVVETVAADSFLLTNLPFIEVTGNSYRYAQEATLGGAAVRTVNNGYTEATGTFAEKTATLAILGGYADVDRYIIQTRGGTIEDHRTATTAMKAKATRLLFHDLFINGNDSVTGEFDGIDVLIDGTSQEISTATNGMPIVGTDSDDRQAFFDKIDELLSLVDGGADVLIMNADVLAKFKSAARRESVYDETRDAFGNQVASYNGVPLVDIGNNASGAAIIAQNETQGSSEVASSIYAVRFGEDGVVGLTNGWVDVKDLGEIPTPPAYRTRIEWFASVALVHPKAAAVLRGVLAA